MTTSFDSHHHHQHTLYSNRTYASTTTTTRSATTNRQFHPYLTTLPLPLPPINVCENLLYDVAITGHGEAGSATSSSYINSDEHYDNTYINTYDNPIQFLENFSPKSVDIVDRSLHDEDNLYDDAKGIGIDINDDDERSSSSTPRSTSPVLFYLENKSLAVCACIISLLLLLLVGLCIFLLNKLIRPVIINTTVNNHYAMSNLTNTTVIPTMIGSRSTTPLVMLLRRASIHVPISASSTISIPLPNDLAFPYSSCAPDRWGLECENMCKPCGLGVCHPATGKCVCPTGIYGQFCDLWQVNDKPKRGDMTS